MIIQLNNANIYDPANKKVGVTDTLYIKDGVITDKSAINGNVDKTYDLKGKVVMAGAIDIHSHIAGGKNNLARLMMPELHRATLFPAENGFRAGSSEPTMTSFSSGYRYAEMGFTAAFEPAMMPVNARQTHLELADTPIIDKGAYIMIGNEDYFMTLLAQKADRRTINDYVAWMMDATKALAVKVVNPGGVNAFKFNQRSLDLDENNEHYHVTPRQVLMTLSRALLDLGVTHPLHVHGCNLGVAGSVRSTLDTINGAEGLPLHITHIQFHAYGDEGEKGFSSGAAEIAEAVNKNPNITVDVGQIMFGQTVTESGDVMHQHAASKHADPKKWVCVDIECQGGCGLVPFHYRDKDYVNALQWAIGLEIFLLVEDPWRVFLTSDHPNGAPFTCYPHLMRLLMDKSYRASFFKHLHPEAQRMSNLDSITREYTLEEIAIMTRAAPARVLGLTSQGHLGIGAQADVVVYTPNENKETMFAKPDYVFKDGTLVAQKGKVVASTMGRHCIARPQYDRGALKGLEAWYDSYQGMHINNAMVTHEDFGGYEDIRFLEAHCQERHDGRSTS